MINPWSFSFVLDAFGTHRNEALLAHLRNAGNPSALNRYPTPNKEQVGAKAPSLPWFIFTPPWKRGKAR